MARHPLERAGPLTAVRDFMLPEGDKPVRITFHNGQLVSWGDPSMPTHFIVSTDTTNHGDAFRFEDVARKQFEASPPGKFVRLIHVDGGKQVELERRNWEHCPRLIHDVAVD